MPNHRLRSFFIAGTVLMMAPSLSGCIVAAAGAGAASGYAVFGQELGPEQQLRDATIKAVLRQSWGQYNQEVVHDLDATVYDGRVLITGRVPKEEWRDEAVKRAWKVDNVKEVYNEIEVGPDTHFIDEVRDTGISTRLRNDLVFDGQVRSINYDITTENGVVYIIGTARSQAELDRVTDYARNTSDVRRVVSYVRIRSGEPGEVQTGAAANAAPATASSRPTVGAPTPLSRGPAPGDTPPDAPTPRSDIEVTPLQ
ncbi:MAG TPA: BON domain-containing protein [Stellaceae bacterium]|nr:BON domain-containing protein [Stellaceae bacterium]